MRDGTLTIRGEGSINSFDRIGLDYNEEPLFRV